MKEQLLISSERQHELIERWEKADGSLTLSEEQFRLGIVNSPIPVIMHAEDGEVLTVSRSWTELTGYTREDDRVIHSWLTEAYGFGGDGVRSAMQNAFLPPVNGDQGMHAVVFDITTRDGEKRTWSFNASVPGLLADGRRFVVGMAEDITERKRSEVKLAEQGRLLEALTESVLDGILIVSPDGRMLHFNQQFLDIWNFPPEIIEQKSDEAALAWASEQTSDPAAFLARVTDIYSDPDSQFREEMPMKDGRIYERFGAAVQHGETRLGWVWTFRDITERKRAEEEISESEQRMRLAMNAVKMYSWEIDVETRQGIISPNAAEVLGFERGAEPTDLQLQISTVIHPDDRARVAEALERSFVTGEFHEEQRFIAPHTEEIVWAETQGIARRDESGKPVKIFGVTQNITDRKLADDALRESEENFRNLADNISQFAWMTDETGSIFWYNERWYEYTGTSFEQMQGWGWTAVHHPDEVDRVIDRFERHIKSGEVWEDTFPLRSKTGEYRWFLSRARPIRDENGKIVRWFGTNTDITESIEAERTLAEKRSLQRLVAAQEEERTRIARDIHDHLGQQLTALRLKLQILRSQGGSVPEVNELIEEIQTIAEKLDEDIDFIAWELRPSALDNIGLVSALDRFVREWSNHFEVEADFHSALFGPKRLGPDIEPVLYRIAQEALNNISKHSQATKISVILARERGCAVLSISDNGIGFDPEKRDFDGSRDQGVGLIGMSERAAYVGGTIEIQSDAGKGTTVTVRIPLPTKDRKLSRSG